MPNDRSFPHTVRGASLAGPNPPSLLAVRPYNELHMRFLTAVLRNLCRARVTEPSGRCVPGGGRRCRGGNVYHLFPGTAALAGSTFPGVPGLVSWRIHNCLPRTDRTPPSLR